MDGGGRRQLMDGAGNGGQWNNQQGGQNVTAALSQTSELLKGLTNLLGHQLMNPNQMGGQGDGQYGGNQSWGQGMDQGGNYGGGYQSNNSGGGGSGNRGYNNDNMNYGNYNKSTEISSSSPSASRYSGDNYASRKRPVDQQSGRYGNKKVQRRSEYNSSGNYSGGGGNWGNSYRGNY